MAFFPRLRFRKGTGTTYVRPRMRLSDSDGLYGITARLQDDSDGDEVVVQFENTRFLIVEEQDGNPVAIDVRRMKVPSGALVDEGSGVVRIGTVAYYESGAGAVVTDGDFAATPANGTLAVAHDTTSGNSFLYARANGTWKKVQIT